jgi:secondary thiamine-phosphate synthase enzyme
VVYQRSINVATGGRGTFEVTRKIESLVAASGMSTGLCHVFIQHTSASLILCENADPSVRTDLETFMGDIAPDGDGRFVHDQEGPDDMPAHIRSVITQSEITLPIRDGRCVLGTWQGLYLWEHRTSPHRRSLLVTIYGEA